MGAKFSARECIPIEYIEEQMREYAKFDHLRANAEFLNWFVKDYKDNAMADYECEADTPQTDCYMCKWMGDRDVCGRCRNRNLFAVADTPQTEQGEYCPTCGQRYPKWMREQTVQKIAEFQKMCGIEIDPDRMTDCGWK